MNYKMQNNYWTITVGLNMNPFGVYFNGMILTAVTAGICGVVNEFKKYKSPRMTYKIAISIWPFIATTFYGMMLGLIWPVTLPSIIYDTYNGYPIIKSYMFKKKDYEDYEDY